MRMTVASNYRFNAAHPPRSLICRVAAVRLSPTGDDVKGTTVPLGPLLWGEHGSAAFRALRALLGVEPPAPGNLFSKRLCLKRERMIDRVRFAGFRPFNGPQPLKMVV